MDLHGLFRHLKIESAFLAGCGLGASTVVDFAIDHPRRAAGLVLVNPALSGFTYETPEGPVDYLPIHQRATPALKLVRVPVMTITGEPTSPAIQESCDLIQSSIPNVKKARLAGTALLPNLGRPVQFNRIVLTFLEWAESEIRARQPKPSTGKTNPLPAGCPPPD
jgi:pimeloyl-ACP methyl ester carboxylesterase